MSSRLHLAVLLPALLAASPAVAQPDPLVITGVTVIPMTGPERIGDATVVIDRGRLDAMIDAAGRRLNPDGFKTATDPESIIRAELAAIEKAWNDADLTRHMAPYADSATMMGSRGLIRGRATIHASMERSFWREGKPLQQLRFEDIEVRMVGGNDAAIVTGRFVLTGGDRPEASGRFTTIWELQDGRWVTVHDHSS